MTTKFYYGDGDLASFTCSFSDADSYSVLSNTETYKHVVGVKDGKEVQFLWFREEHAG